LFGNFDDSFYSFSRVQSGRPDGNGVMVREQIEKREWFRRSMFHGRFEVSSSSHLEAPGRTLDVCD
jgi:hypothetical protein